MIDLRYDLSANTHLGDWRVDGVTQTQVSPERVSGHCQHVRDGRRRKRERLHGELRRRGCRHLRRLRTRWQKAALCGSSPLDGDVGRRRELPQQRRNGHRRQLVATTRRGADDLNDRCVRQQANNAGSYVEFGLQATTETCIRDVSAVLAYHAAATAADNGKTSIFDGASETVVFGGDMSQTGLQYKSAVVTPAAASWNQTAVNGLVARVGYSTDSARIHAGTRSCSKPRSTDSWFTMAQAKPARRRRPPAFCF